MATCKDCLHTCYIEEVARVEETCNMFLDKSKYEPVKRGKWIFPTVIGGRAWQIPHCSVCYGVPFGTDGHTKYCPNCGAKMDLEE